MKEENQNPINWDELAYLAGALRDGYVSFVSQPYRDYRVVIVQKNKEWLENVIRPIITNNFPFIKNINLVQLKGVQRIVIYSKRLVQWVIENFQFATGKEQIFWKTPQFVKEAYLSDNLTIVKNYIQGFFDAEGSISFWKATIKNKEYLQQKLTITQMSDNSFSCEVLDDIQTFLKKFNIYVRIIQAERNKPTKFRLETSDRKEIEKFWKKIGSRHPLKINKFISFFDLLQSGENTD